MPVSLRKSAAPLGACGKSRDSTRAGFAKVVGKKIGLTSIAMQKLIGVDEPDYGHLFDHMLVREGEPISCSRLLLPKVERGGLVFVLNKRLQGPGVTIAEVLRATEGVMASIEIVDSRVRDWKIKLADTIADNASSARFVVGSRLICPGEVDLRLLGMVFEKNGEVVDTGAGAAVMGHPASSNLPRLPTRWENSGSPWRKARLFCRAL